MAKPICVVKVDSSISFNNNGISSCFDVQKFLDEKLTDYHVLVVPFEQPKEEYFEPMQVEVFYDKDFTEIQYQELKDIVNDYITQKTKQ